MIQDFDFGEKNDLILKRFDPLSFTLKDAIEVFELNLQSFIDNPELAYILSDTFQYRLDEESLFEAEPCDSIKRIQLRKRRIQVYEDILYYFSYRLQCNLASMNGYVGYGLYTKDKNGKKGRIVGLCDFRYPCFMEDELLQELRPNTTKGFGWFKWKVYSIWINLRFKVFNIYLLIKYKDHPFINSRVTYIDNQFDLEYEKHYPLDPDGEDKLSQLTYDQLKNKTYPKASCVYLMNFYIHPNYWGKGVGTSLLRHCISLVPPQLTPFLSAHNQTISYGPQKFQLRATDMGLHMYKKVGFTTVLGITVHGINGEEISTTIMEYINECK